jgi:hypothetical protein
MPDGVNKGSFVKAYSAQIGRFCVAGDRGPEVTLQTIENGQLLPMLAQIAKNLEQKPENASADADSPSHEASAMRYDRCGACALRSRILESF